MSYIERLKFLIEYNPKKGGLLNEIVEGGNIDGWVNFGILNHHTWDKETPYKKYYIFANPNAEQTDDLSSFKKDNIALSASTEDLSDSKDFNATYDSRYDKFEIYPEYKDSYFETVITGVFSQSARQKKHEDLMNKLFTIDNKLILHHNSSYKITDGIVKRGKTNRWSNNRDWGVYFWASKNSGNDPSGIGQYTYFCLIDLELCYDVTNNVDNLKSNKEVSERHPYHLKDWPNGNAVACQTYSTTPIWCIRDNRTGRFYDSEWNEIEKPEVL